MRLKIECKNEAVTVYAKLNEGEAEKGAFEQLKKHGMQIIIMASVIFDLFPEFKEMTLNTESSD